MVHAHYSSCISCVEPDQGHAHAGITLSKSQVKRGGELAAEQGLGNCSFQVMDALHMDFPDDTFDLVWACESGEHMPDKKKYIEEMTRVLKPGTLQPLIHVMHACILLVHPSGQSLWASLEEQTPVMANNQHSVMACC